MLLSWAVRHIIIIVIQPYLQCLRWWREWTHFFRVSTIVQFSSSYSFQRNTRSCCSQCIHSTLPQIVPMYLLCSCLLVSSICHKPCWRNVSPHDSIPTCYILSFSQLSLWTWGLSQLTILPGLFPISLVQSQMIHFVPHYTVLRFHGYFLWMQLCMPNLTFWSNQIWFCSFFCSPHWIWWEPYNLVTYLSMK